MEQHEMTTVDKTELSEITCDGEGFELMADLIMALAEGTPTNDILKSLKVLAVDKYYELSGEKAADEWLEGVAYDDYVASVHHSAMM